MTSLPNPSAAVDPVAASLRNIGELISKGQVFEAEKPYLTQQWDAAGKEKLHAQPV